VFHKVSFLTSYAAVASVAAALQQSLRAMLITPTAASTRFRNLTVLGHTNQCETALAVVETEREAHDEPSNAVVRLKAIELVIVASDIELAVCNAVPNTR
jgi:hypothetical protein